MKLWWQHSPPPVHGELQTLLDDACGSFSFISRGTRLTYDFRKIYNRLILAREWQ